MEVFEQTMYLDHPAFQEVANVGRICTAFANELNSIYERQKDHDTEVKTVLYAKLENREGLWTLNELCLVERLITEKIVRVETAHNTAKQKCTTAWKRYTAKNEQFKTAEKKCETAEENCKTAEENCKTAEENCKTAEENCKTAADKYKKCKTAYDKSVVAVRELGSTRKRLWKTYMQQETDVNNLKKKRDQEIKYLMQTTKRRENLSRSVHETGLSIDEKILYKVENELYQKIVYDRAARWLNFVHEEVRKKYARYQEDKLVEKISYWMFRAVRNSITHYMNHQNNPKFAKALEIIGTNEFSCLTYMINTFKEFVPATIGFITQYSVLLPETWQTLLYYCPRMTRPVVDTFNTLAKCMIDAVKTQCQAENLICQFDTSDENIPRGYTAFIWTATPYTFPQPHNRILIEIKDQNFHFNDGTYEWKVNAEFLDTDYFIRVTEASTIHNKNFVHGKNCIYIISNKPATQYCKETFLSWCSAQIVHATERKRRWSDLSPEIQTKLKDRNLTVMGKSRKFSHIFLQEHCIIFPELAQFVDDHVLPNLINNEDLNLLAQTVTIPAQYMNTPISLETCSRFNILFGRPLIGKSTAINIFGMDSGRNSLLYNFDFSTDNNGSGDLTLQDVTKYFMPGYENNSNANVDLLIHLINTENAMVIVFDGVEKLLCEKQKNLQYFVKIVQHISSLPSQNKTMFWIVTRSHAKRFIKNLLQPSAVNVIEFPPLSLDNFKIQVRRYINSINSGITDLKEQEIEEMMNNLVSYFQINRFLCSVFCEAAKVVLHKDVIFEKYQVSKLLEESYFLKSDSKETLSKYEDMLRKSFVMRHIIFAFNILYIKLSTPEYLNKIEGSLVTLRHAIYSAGPFDEPVKLSQLDYGLLQLENVENVRWVDFVPFYDPTMISYFLAMWFLETRQLMKNDESFRARAQVLNFLKTNKENVGSSINVREIKYYLEKLSEETTYKRAYDKLMDRMEAESMTAQSNNQLSKSY